MAECNIGTTLDISLSGAQKIILHAVTGDEQFHITRNNDILATDDIVTTNIDFQNQYTCVRVLRMLMFRKVKMVNIFKYGVGRKKNLY